MIRRSYFVRCSHAKCHDWLYRTTYVTNFSSYPPWMYFQFIYVVFESSTFFSNYENSMNVFFLHFLQFIADIYNNWRELILRVSLCLLKVSSFFCLPNPLVFWSNLQELWQLSFLLRSEYLRLLLWHLLCPSWRLILIFLNLLYETLLLRNDKARWDLGYLEQLDLQKKWLFADLLMACFWGKNNLPCNFFLRHPRPLFKIKFFLCDQWVKPIIIELPLI